MNRFFWLSLLILASISVAFAQDGPRVTASPLRKSLNLSDLPSAESARDNLGLPDNVEQAGSVASLGVNVFTGKQTMTQSVSKSATLWHGHFENTGTGAGSYLGVYLGTPNRYGYIRGFDYDYGTFGLADSLEFGSNDFGAIRLHQTLATGVVGIMFGNSAPYTAVATWTADGVMLNAGDIIANGVNVVDGIASAEAMAASQNALASAAYGYSSDTRSISAAMDASQNALASGAYSYASGTRATLDTLVSSVATGTSGTKLPLLDTACTWSQQQTMAGASMTNHIILNGNSIFGGGTDGANDKKATLGGGDSMSNSRGGYIVAAGNEETTAVFGSGSVSLVQGDNASAGINMYYGAGSVLGFSLNRAGNVRITNWLSNDGDSEGISISSGGGVTVGSNTFPYAGSHVINGKVAYNQNTLNDFVPVQYYTASQTFTATSSSNPMSERFLTRWSVASGVSITGDSYGIFGQFSRNYMNSTVDDTGFAQGLYGLYLSVGHGNSVATMTPVTKNIISIYAGTLMATGVCSSTFGVYIPAPVVGTGIFQGNNYGVFQASTTVGNVFYGPVAVATTTYPATAAFVVAGNVMIATGSPLYGGTGNLWVAGTISGKSYSDHSDAPESLAEAYEIVSSHFSSGGKVDHSKLSPKAWGTKFTPVKTGRKIQYWEDVEETVGGVQAKIPYLREADEVISVPEPDPTARNVSKTLTAQAMVIQDLLKRIEKLEAKP